MRVAVPSNDGLNIAEHFGKSKQYLVFDIHEGHAALESVRDNHGCSGEHGGESCHTELLGPLAGCEAVVCAGIGIGAVVALKTAGFQVVSIPAQGNAAEAIRLWLTGRLNGHVPGGCGCKHE